MTHSSNDISIADTRRQLLSLSACVGVVLIVIVTIASYGMHRLGTAVARNEVAIDALGEMADAARVAQVTFKTQVQEWKNTLLRGHESHDFKFYHGAFLVRRGQVQAELGALASKARALGFPAAEIDALKKLHSELDVAYDDALASFRADDPLSIRTVDQKVRGRDRPVNEAFDALVSRVKGFSDEKRAGLRAEIAGIASSMSLVLWAVLAIGFVVLFLAAFVAVRTIRKY